MSKSNNNKPTTTTTAPEAAAPVPAVVALASSAQPAEYGISRLDDATAAAWGADGWSPGARFIKLREGDVVTGILVGAGSVDVADPATGGAGSQTVGTWLVEIAPGDVVEFLGAHELDRQLGPIAERIAAGRGRYEVRIARGPEERVGGRAITRYRTATRQIGGARG